MTSPTFEQITPFSQSPRPNALIHSSPSKQTTTTRKVEHLTQEQFLGLNQSSDVKLPTRKKRRFWTSEEEEKLLTLTRTKERDWNYISQMMGNNITPENCYDKFYNIAKKRKNKTNANEIPETATKKLKCTIHHWTPEEEKRLFEAVELFQLNNRKNWKAIAKYVGNNLTSDKCKDRYGREKFGCHHIVRKKDDSSHETITPSPEEEMIKDSSDQDWDASFDEPSYTTLHQTNDQEWLNFLQDP